MIDVLQTVISQYENSPRLIALIEEFNASVDPSADIENFYDLIWNIETAAGFGLDIWGKIVGVSRTLTVPISSEYLGFSESGSGSDSYNTYGYGILYSGPQTGSQVLSDAAFRTLIYLKALTNISDLTIPSYNKILQFIFAPFGVAYAVDDGAMRLRLVFEFYLEPYQLAILTNSGAMPRPAGVSLSIFQVNVSGTLGFSEATVGSTGAVLYTGTLPSELPYVPGVIYDTSGLFSYATYGFGTFGQEPILVA